MNLHFFIYYYLNANTFIFGLYLAIILAVNPFSVMTSIREASISTADLTAAAQIAS
jgi:hypothetical protein